MDNQKMELRKLRDFSENLNDTFQFIRQELKPLLGSFLAICGVFIILSGIVGGIYQQNNIGILKAIFSGHVKPNETLGLSSVYNWTHFLTIILGVLSYVLMNIVLTAYFKIYLLKNKVSPTIEEVWNESVQHILPLFFFSMIYAVITIVSAFFCIVPFFYFSVVFAPFTMIYVIEGGSFGRGFNRCFALIKDNYWMSLAIYLIAYIVYAFGSTIVGAIISLVAGLAAYFTTKDVGATVGIVTGILSVFTHIFYIVFYVSIALNYFNLAENIDGDGLMQRIDSIGSSETDTVQEQY